ncbi:FAD:protein FMN transferase [Marinilabilia salmonicolor]|uniref:FAD:protein FMN transferase n=1 Tax=Marinilabilia salmonicolor TaxID=989 RepID=UPI00046ACDC7|nr:FAD:protein FMN transferase [Marinilabilia salmonicolor]
MKQVKTTTALLFSVLLLISGCNKSTWIKNQGEVFGTYYHIIYESPGGEDLHQEVLQALRSVNKSLSTYDSTSVISLLNQSKKGTPTDPHFRKVFEAGRTISAATGGAFDMTVAPLVNAWGFGFTNKEEMTPEKVKALKQLVGMNNLKLTDDSVLKSRPEIMMDASAIAKGYGVDVAAQILSDYGCKNFLVEIGGEIVCRGENSRDEHWKVGIDKPIDDPVASNRELQFILKLSGKALATSGNYRQFYIDEKTGKKYAHTIDPISGMPVEHSLLSASVIADDCMTADAYATACMVLGVEKSMELMKKHPEMAGCFIYSTEDGMEVSLTDGFDKYITN